MSDFIERLNTEAKELKEKYTKLGDYINSDKFNELTPDEKSLLKLQYRQMLPYLHTLQARVNFYASDVTEEEVEATLDNEDEEPTNE
ncbi:MAG: hypothetical protein CMC55_08535 [Flavobacteriaceae bacterium]|nr:hypothetical protein [Flavobacteriaceae bacterium]|tara:strand:- start:448 stop:708 length:261 start_codon:yes stop_codon:yes gene_type:complete